MTSTEDIAALAEGLDSFLGEACPVDRLHKAFDGDDQITRSIWDGMMELGLGGLAAPEEHGGLGLSLAGLAAISERIGWAGAPGPWIGHTLACLAIATAGDDRQKARWLPWLARGEVVGTVALHERDAWAPDQWRIDATDGRLTGGKDHVMAAGEAEVAVVGVAGGGLGLVELRTPHVSVAPFESTDRTRPIARLVFDDAPIDLLPGGFGQGLLDAAAVLLAADAHGGCERMVLDVAEYSKVRVQFGQVIAQFQAVKHRLADLALAIYHNGAYYRDVAGQIDAGGAEASTNASLLKALLTETYSNVARVATESYGGIGYTWVHSAHIWLRRAMLDYAWLGSPAAHRRRAAAGLGW